MPAPEFLKLIENSNQEVLSSLFYDNVRHWQEWNPVNAEMRDTLTDAGSAVLFPLLNNGVTILARRVNPTAHKLLLEDYQVVNGCQTSYVLHECRSSLHDGIMVPVRVIATQDEGIKNAIIKATNRQTAVTEDQLFALSEFPKKLEIFFPSFDGRRRLYYERRSRQYNNVAGIEKVRVINMTILVRSFASVFLSQPHRTTRNYKALLRMVGAEIFNKEHRMEPYYVAAFMHYRLEYLFRCQALQADLKPARYHIQLAYRLLASKEQLPRLNARAMGRYCTELMAHLWDDDVSRATFERAADAVREVARGNLHRDNIRTEPFTTALTEALVEAV